MSYDITITQRKNWIAQITLCDGSTPPPAARGEIRRILGAEQVIQAGAGNWVNYDIVDYPDVSQSSDYRDGTTITLGAAFYTYRISSSVTPGGLRVATLSPRNANGLPVTVSGQNIRVVFPEDYFRSEVAFGQAMFEYKVFAGAGLLLSGKVTAGPYPDDEDEEDAEPPDSGFEVCNFTSNAAA